jgi:hypothetical protein
MGGIERVRFSLPDAIFFSEVREKNGGLRSPFASNSSRAE